MSSASQAMHLEKVRLVFGDSRVIAMLFCTRFVGLGPFGKMCPKGTKKIISIYLPPGQFKWKSGLLEKENYRLQSLRFWGFKISFSFRYLDIRNFTPALATADAPVVEMLGFPSFLSPPKINAQCKKKALIV